MEKKQSKKSDDLLKIDTLVDLKGGCAICGGKAKEEGRRLAIDHNMLDPSGGNAYFQATFGGTTPEIKFGDLSELGNGNTYEFNDSTSEATVTRPEQSGEYFATGAAWGSDTLETT